MTSLAIGLVASAVLVTITAYVFYRTVVTGEWRNRVPNESESWIGPFYLNRADRRIFLPKRTGLGWTINLGRPLGVAVAASILMLVFVIILVATLSP